MSNVGQKELNVNKSSVKTVYILVGPKGSGKTFIGNALEDRLGILFIRVEKLLIEYVEKNGTTKVVRYGKRGMKSTGTVRVPGEPVTTSIGWHNDDGTLLGVVRQGGYPSCGGIMRQRDYPPPRPRHPLLAGPMYLIDRSAYAMYEKKENSLQFIKAEIKLKPNRQLLDGF